jgi:outer membrane receptor protein involved in Fe transport
MSAVAGLTGLFGRDWRYDVSVDWSRGRTRDENDYDPNLNTGNFNMALAGGTPPVLLYDSRDVMPNDPDELLLFLRAGGRQERSISQGLAVSVDGPVLELPAGPLRMAFGVDARRDTAKTAQAIPDPDGSSSSLVGDGFEREVSSAYAEAVAPLVSPAHDIPLVNRLDFTAAVRYDSYSDIGGDYSPRYGLQWRPVSWLMVRGTRNHAFRAPTMYDLYRRVVDGSYTFFAFDGLVDPLRNDEPLDGLTVDTIVGGNNNLKPERSASNNIGIVLDVPLAMFAGLSLSVDVVDFHYADRIGGLGFEETFLLFPGLVTRGDPLPGDPPGMPGPITRVDRRAVNTAETDILSIDYQVKYTRATSVGTFDLRAAATVYDSWESKSVPSAPAQSSSHFRPDRYTWQSYWTRGPLGLGLSGFHQARRFNDAARTTLRFGAATEWNSQMSYDFGKAGFSGRDSWLASILADSKVSLTIFNLFDREPPHLQGGRGGFAVTDPRMRRYSLSFQKTF